MRPRVDRQHAHALLNALLDLVESTDPDRGNGDPTGKDQAAAEALILTGRLLEMVAAWALHHRFGTALLALEPGSPDLDSHAPEEMGSRPLVADASAVDLGNKQARAALVELARALPNAFPPGMARYLPSSLKALDMGTSRFPFSPADVKAKGRGAYLRWEFERAFVEHVYFHGGHSGRTLDGGAAKAGFKVMSAKVAITWDCFEKWSKNTSREWRALACSVGLALHKCAPLNEEQTVWLETLKRPTDEGWRAWHRFVNGQDPVNGK